MAHYLIYKLDRFSGHIDRIDELAACDDVSAICTVQDRAGDAPLELWRDGRKVRRFDGKPTVFDEYAARPRA